MRIESTAQTTAVAWQKSILILLFCGYLIGCLALPRGILLAGVGVVVFAAARAVGRAAARRAIPPMEPMIVWMVGTLTLFFVSIKFVQFPVTAASLSVLGLGSFILVGAWGVHALSPQSHAAPAVTRDGVLAATKFGVAISLGISVYALLVVGVFALAGFDDPTMKPGNVALLVAGYAAAGLLGGIVVGLLRPLAVWPLGRMVIGIPVTTLIYSSVGIVLYLMNDPKGPASVTEALMMGAAIGVFAGPAGALMFAHGFSGVGPSVRRSRADIR